MAFIVDTDAPASFTPTLNVTSPTTNTTPILSFSTTDNVAVDHYRVRINSGSFTTQSSPYQLPTLVEGSNTLTVRAYDTSNNYTEGQVTVVVDYSQPATFTPTLNVTSPTNNTTPIVTFSTTDNDGIDHYEVKVGSGTFSTQTSPYQLPTLSGGFQTITVRAFDTAGNFRDGTVSVTIDTTPPNSFTPTLNVTSPTSNTQPTISFATTDNIAVSFYQVKVDNGSYSTQVSPYQLPVLSLGDHTITVKATDTAGNERTGWVDVTIVSEVDNPPAAFTLTFSPGSFTTSTAPQVSFSTTDDVGVNRYEVQVDGGAFSVQTSPYQLPTLSEGAHTVTVRAYDTTEQSTESTATVTVDLTAPAAFSAAFAVTSPTNDRTPALTFGTTDTVGVHHYEIKVDSGSFVTHSSPYSIPSQTDGEHTATVRAYDAAGNYTETSVSIIIDGTAPDAFTPTFNVSSPTTDTQPILSFATTDANGIANYQVRIDGGSYSTQTSPYQLPTLSEGSHTVTVKATDTAGNSREQTVSITVDLNGPDAFTPTLNVTSPSNNTTPTVTFTTTDTDGIDHYEVQVDGSSFTTQTSPYQLPTLSDGSHTIVVRAFDTLMNYTDGSVTVIIDTTGPTIAISAPDKVSNVDISSTQVTVTDSHGVSTSDVSITGGTKTCSQTTANRVSCSMVIASSGTLSVTATDAAGNLSSQTETGYIIETTAPVISITAPTKVTLAAITDTTIRVTDNYGIGANEVIAISGGTISCVQTSSTQVDCSSIIRFTGSLVINADDLAGNAASLTEVGYDISNTPPLTFTPTLNTASVTSNRTPVLFFSTTDSDGLAYYMVKIDDGSFSQQVSPYQVPTLSDGLHTLTIRAFDTYGNFTDGQIAVTVDGSLPAATPTPSPSPSVTPSPTPTATPAASPTPSPSPTATAATPEKTSNPQIEETVAAATPSATATPAGSLFGSPDDQSPDLLDQLSEVLESAGNTLTLGDLSANPVLGPAIETTVQVAAALPEVAAAAVVAVQVVSVSTLAVTAISHGSLTSASQIPTLFQILTAAGLVPKRKRHGLVFESRTGKPLPFATLSVLAGREGNEKLVATLVSDMFGRYQEPQLLPGVYHLVAEHPGHTFPSRSIKPWHLTESEYYQGQAFTVTTAILQQPLAVPMDSSLVKSMTPNWQETWFLTLQSIYSKWSWLSYPLLVVSGIESLAHPNLFTLGLTGLYAVLNAAKLTAFFKKPSVSGVLFSPGQTQKVVHARVTLANASGLVVAVTETDELGRFKFFVEPGEYVINANTDTLALSTPSVGAFTTINTAHQGSRRLRLKMERPPVWPSTSALPS